MSWTDKLWDFFINKGHVILAAVCQSTIFVMHYRYKQDISTNVQTTVNWFYGFLAGHFGCSQVWPDKTTAPDPGVGSAGEKG